VRFSRKRQHGSARSFFQGLGENTCSFTTCIEKHCSRPLKQRCAGAGVQESTPAGVGVFQQEPEQDQEWIFFYGTGAGAGVIFIHSIFEICIDYLHSTQFVTGVKQEQESIIFL